MNDNTRNAQEGLKRLSDHLKGQSPALPVSEDAQLLDVLRGLEHADFSQWDASMKATRANIRYLAALWPDAKLGELTDRIHMLIANRGLLPEDVRAILAGVSLSERDMSATDVSLILQGKQLHDPTRRTNEVPLGTIQLIGKCLRDGMTLTETSRLVRVHIDTVHRIESTLGLAARYQERLLDDVVACVREGMSVRQVARRHGISRGRAHRLIVVARGILVELGELPEGGTDEEPDA